MFANESAARIVGSGVVTDAPVIGRLRGEGEFITDAAAVLPEDVVASHADQVESRDGCLQEDRDVRWSGDRVGAVEPVKSRRQSTDAERRVFGEARPGDEGEIDLFLKRLVHGRFGKVIHHPAQKRPTGRGDRVGCRQSILQWRVGVAQRVALDRKSTRLNSSHIL